MNGSFLCSICLVGEQVPRKGGPGVTQSDLLIINKIDLAEAVGADLSVMERDAKGIREDGPILFTNLKTGLNVDEVANYILASWNRSKN